MKPYTHTIRISFAGYALMGLLLLYLVVPMSSDIAHMRAVNPATSAVLRSTHNAATAQAFLDKIAFYSNRDGNFEIYAMNADGSVQVNLTNNPGDDYAPGWSSTANKLAFVTWRSNMLGDVYWMNIDGASQTLLVSNGDEPAWKPDGAKVAFLRHQDISLGDEVYVVNPDGSNPTNLTNNSVRDFGPITWAPDGSLLAFSSERDGNYEIYTMNADGTQQTRLTNNSAFDSSAAWSPGGTKIAFTSFRDGNAEIYLMNTDGSGVTRLTNNSATDSSPAWSPDGTRIAFSSHRDGNMEIYVMNADGTGVVRLTNSADIDDLPSWGRIALNFSVFLPLVSR